MPQPRLERSPARRGSTSRRGRAPRTTLPATRVAGRALLLFIALAAVVLLGVMVYGTRAQVTWPALPRVEVPLGMTGIPAIQAMPAAAWAALLTATLTAGILFARSASGRPRAAYAAVGATDGGVLALPSAHTRMLRDDEMPAEGPTPARVPRRGDAFHVVLPEAGGSERASGAEAHGLQRHSHGGLEGPISSWVSDPADDDIPPRPGSVRRARGKTGSRAA